MNNGNAQEQPDTKLCAKLEKDKPRIHHQAAGRDTGKRKSPRKDFQEVEYDHPTRSRPRRNVERVLGLCPYPQIHKR